LIVTDDLITATGTMTLGGTLAPNISFSPSSSETITIIDANAISGTFSTISPALPMGWTIAYNSPNTGEVSLVFTALPVELISFSAKKMERSVMLNWATASEINNDGFAIQRSRDGINFEEIGWENGSGDSDSYRQYDFEDFESKANGIYYYRLKQIDFDGKYEYSTVAAVSFAKENEINIFPNPVRENIQIAGMESGQFLILDYLGKVVKEGNFNSPEINISELPVGIYFVKIGTSGDWVTKRIVKR